MKVNVPRRIFWTLRIVGGLPTALMLCCNALCTGINRGKLSGVSVCRGERQANYRLFSTGTTVDSARVDVEMFSSDPYTLGFYFWPSG